MNRRRIGILTAACILTAGCGDDRPSVDLSTLDVGNISTAVRVIPSPPSLSDGIVLEGIRMSEAVADSSQFDSPLIYLRQAGPVRDTASLVPVVGEAGRKALDRLGWVAGYHAAYADTEQPRQSGAPDVGRSITIALLRFPDDAAARRAASALESTNWADLGKTIAAPLPKHREIAARYTPGRGLLHLDTAIGPFVLRVVLESGPEGIEKRVADLEAVVDEEEVLLSRFEPTPVAEIPSLPRDPDGLLARMVATDPARQPPPSADFAVYGPTGALRAQPPAIRRDHMYAKWGVDRLAVSGRQRLYRLPDRQAARDMWTELTAESSSAEGEIGGEQNVPDARCSRSSTPTGDTPYRCRLVFDNFYTEIRADTASTVKEMTAAQYVLLATH